MPLVHIPIMPQDDDTEEMSKEDHKGRSWVRTIVVALVIAISVATSTTLFLTCSQ